MAVGAPSAIAAGDAQVPRPPPDHHGDRAGPAPDAAGAGPRAQAARPRPAHLKLHVAGIRDRSLGVGKKVTRGGVPASVRPRPARAGQAGPKRPRGHEDEPVREAHQGREGRPLQVQIGEADQARPLPRHRPAPWERPAGPRLGARSAKFKIRYPDLDPGRPEQHGQDLQPPPPRAGLLHDPRQALRAEDRLRGDGVPQGERDEAHLQRLAGDLQEAGRRPGQLPPQATRAPASTWRSTSRGR